MGENIELLIKIQDQIIKVRRLAAALGDGLGSRLLLDLADETETKARDVDNQGE